MSYAKFCQQYPIYTDHSGHWYGWERDEQGQPRPYPVYRNAIKAGRQRKRYWRYHHDK